MVLKPSKEYFIPVISVVSDTMNELVAVLKYVKQYGHYSSSQNYSEENLFVKIKIYLVKTHTPIIMTSEIPND